MNMKNPNRRKVLKTLGGGVAGAVALGGNVSARGGGLKRELAEVRSATAKYNDPANAYADGYVAFDHNSDPVALEDVVDDAESVCGMGFHFGNLALIGSTDRTTPQVLVYGVDDDDNLILGAVEYIVPDAIPGDPDFFDHDDEAEHWDPGPFPDVHSLHVWVHTHNPDGVFNHSNPRKQFSPDGCQHH